jgi:hypothetical protein
VFGAGRAWVAGRVIWRNLVVCSLARAAAIGRHSSTANSKLAIIGKYAASIVTAVVGGQGGAARPADVNVPPLLRQHARMNQPRRGRDGQRQRHLEDRAEDCISVVSCRKVYSPASFCGSIVSRVADPRSGSASA